MSYRMFFKKLTAEAGKLRRREVQLQLSRFVETYEMTANPSEADLPDLIKFLQIISLLVRQHDDFDFNNKELKLLTTLYAFMRRDQRPSGLIAAVHMIEILLLEERYRLVPVVLPTGEETRPPLVDILPVLLPPCRTLSLSCIARKMVNVLASPVASMQQQLDVLLVCTKFLNPSLNERKNSSDLPIASFCDEEEPIADDILATLLNHVVQSLRLAGMMQGVQPTPLRQSSAKEANRRRTTDKATTELDGSDCIDRFTLLNLANVYTPEQLMHMEVFAVLKVWLRVARSITHAKGRTTGNSEGGGNRGAYLNEVVDRLREDATELVQRLLDQCERPHSAGKLGRDQALLESVLLETIDLVHHLIELEPNIVTRLYPRCQTIFEKQNLQALSGDLPVVMVRLMSFLVAHAPSMGVSAGRFYEAVYGDLLTAGHFMDPLFADELMRYTMTNLEALCEDSTMLGPSPLRRFSPNLWKLLAWSPRTHLSRFLELLPALLGEGSALENLHSILELPTLSALLDLRRAVDTGEASQEERRAFQRLPRHHHFLLRATSGQGDTLDRMGELYDGLEAAGAMGHRVAFACDTVTPLLTVYFSVVLEFGDDETQADLVPILLDRAVSLFGPAAHKASVQTALGNGLQSLVALRPQLVFEHEVELCDLLSKASNAAAAPTMFCSALYVVGKFAGAGSELSFSLETMNLADGVSRKKVEAGLRHFYETIECFVYELLSEGTRLPRSADFPFWCVIATALARVAAQMADYTPRCLLCLAKMRQQAPRRLPVDESGRKALEQRIGELSQLLRNPNIGPHVLCPRPELLRGYSAHRDPGSLAMALKEVDRRMAECG